VKTGAQLIAEFEKLAPEKKQIMVDYVVSNGEEIFKAADYSPKEEEWILKEANLCKEKVDAQEHASADELRDSLGLT